MESEEFGSVFLIGIMWLALLLWSRGRSSDDDDDT